MADIKIGNSSIARIAGNIASGLVSGRALLSDQAMERIAALSVHMARLIVDEIERPFTPSDEQSESETHVTKGQSQ